MTAQALICLGLTVGAVSEGALEARGPIAFVVVFVAMVLACALIVRAAFR